MRITYIIPQRVAKGTFVVYFFLYVRFAVAVKANKICFVIGTSPTPSREVSFEISNALLIYCARRINTSFWFKKWSEQPVSTNSRFSISGLFLSVKSCRKTEYDDKAFLSFLLDCRSFDDFYTG